MKAIAKNYSRVAFSFLMFFFGCFIIAEQATANIIIHGTRVIYNEKSREVAVRLENKGTKPSLVQAWIDDGQQNVSVEKQNTPFMVMPPVFRIEPNNGQTMRISFTGEQTLPKDKESVFWLNVLDIPPKPTNVSSSQANMLQIAIKSRIKVFYRPAGLNTENAKQSAESLTWQIVGRQATVKNSSPYYVSLSEVRDAANKRVAEGNMLPPGGSITVNFNRAVSAGEQLKYYYLDDLGARVSIDVKS